MKLSLMPTWSWCHDLAEDAEDPANDDESLGDDTKALVVDGEALHRFCGHLWLNEVMKPTHLVVCWYSAHKINGGTLISPCSYGWFKKPTHMMIKPLKMSWILYAGCWKSTWFMKNIL